MAAFSIPGSHQGSWSVFGQALPDFGITEAVGGLFGTKPTSQGGSNLSSMWSSQPAAATTTKTPTSNVLGANTQLYGPTYNGPQQQAQPTPASPTPQYVQDLTGQVRNDINSGYNSYFSTLDSMLGGLGDQRQAQEGIVNANYDTSLQDLNSQRDSSMLDLNASRRKNEENTSKSLADVSNNIANLFQAGNQYLGARGAADSSAANQYSYALTKLGTKQRGDVLAQKSSIENDIADREAKLKNVYTTELTRLNNDKTSKIAQIAQWFGDAQNQLKQMKANGQLQQGQDLGNLSKQLLSTALQNLSQIDAEHRNMTQQLQTWAQNNSKNIADLRTNMQGISQFAMPGITTQQINGTPTVDAAGNISLPFGIGSSSEDKKKLGIV